MLLVLQNVALMRAYTPDARIAAGSAEVEDGLRESEGARPAASAPRSWDRQELLRAPDLRDYAWRDPSRLSSGEVSVPRQGTLALCNGKTELRVTSTVAIVTVSRGLVDDAARTRSGVRTGGSRSHFDVYTGPRLAVYANEIGADLHAVHDMCAEDTVLPRIAADRGWTLEEVNRLGFEHRARLDKLVLFRFLEHYDRVLWVDDSVYVHPLAPNVFDLVPRGMLGAVYEREGKPDGWGLAYVKLFCEAYAAGECPGLNTIFNSGVMVMDADMRDTLLDPAQWFRIQNIHGLFDQGYFNGMVMRHGIPVFDLSSRWNFVGSQLRMSSWQQRQVTGMVKEDACFAHFTRAVGVGQRESALGEMARAWYGRSDPNHLPRPPGQSTARPGLAPCDQNQVCGDAGCWTVGRTPVEAMDFVVRPIHRAESTSYGPEYPGGIWADPFNAPWPDAEWSLHGRGSSFSGFLLNVTLGFLLNVTRGFLLNVTRAFIHVCRWVYLAFST